MIIYRHSPPIFEEIVSNVLPSVVGIAVGSDKKGRPNIIGSGFAVERSEFYVTCWHVAEEYAKLSKLGEEDLKKAGLKDATLRLALWNGKDTYHWKEVQKGALMSTREEDHDIFIFRLPDVAVPPMVIKKDNIWTLGTEVGVIGFPMGNDLQGEILRPYVIKTIISGGLEYPLKNGHTSERLAIGIALAGGFSGSPVFDSKTGVVLGMVNSKMMESDELLNTWPAGISLATAPRIINIGLDKHIDDTTKRIHKALWPENT